MDYQLKDGSIVSTIPLGRVSFKVGDINEAGYLTIMGRIPNSHPCQTRIVCKCKCGNYTALTLNAFRNGSTKSCGCYNTKIHKELMSKLGKQSSSKDYTKEKNLYYEFIKPLDKYKNKSRIWLIRCKKCGVFYEEIPAMLISNTRRKGNNPCSCWQHLSKGVLKIEDILQTNKIKYIKEKTFETCLSPKGNLMKFDFYIWFNEQPYLIEYDGEQHFQETSFYGNNKENIIIKFMQQQEYDLIKNNWCLENNIPLIRIPYTHFKDIMLEDLIPETSKFLIKGEK